MFQRFARFIPVVAAAVAVALALAVLSRVMVTVNTIARPEYRLAYVLGVVALLGGLGVFAWVKLRPRRTMPARQLPYHRRLRPEDRLGKLYEKHALDRIELTATGAGAERAPARLRNPGRLRVAVAGVRGAGKSALISALKTAVAAKPTGREPMAVELVELSGLDTDRGRNLERLAPAAACDLALFVVDQDLRDYEQAALEALARRQRNVLVVLNKADLMRSEALAETVQAIGGKLAGAAIEADIVSSAAAPRPIVRVGPDGSGEEEVDSPADVSGLIGHLEALAASRGRDGIVVTQAS